MVQAIVQNMAGEKVGEIELDDRVFGVTPNIPLVHQVVLAIEHARPPRAGRTKDRHEIRATGAKWYRQKGTGRARHGSKAANLFVGGYKAHGPKANARSHRLPKRMRRQAMFSALSSKLTEGALLVVDEVTLDDYSTRDVVNMLEGLEAAGRVLLILPAPAADGEGEEDAEARANLQRVMKSTQNVVAMLARVGNNFSVREVVAADCVVMARDALMSLQEEWTS
jgi:large subunit ribosomal protein L4